VNNLGQIILSQLQRWVSRRLYGFVIVSDISVGRASNWASLFEFPPDSPVDYLSIRDVNDPFSPHCSVCDIISIGTNLAVDNNGVAVYITDRGPYRTVFNRSVGGREFHPPLGRSWREIGFPVWKSYRFGVSECVEIAQPDSIDRIQMAIYCSLLKHHKSIKVMARALKRRHLTTKEDEYLDDIRELMNDNRRDDAENW
jgi:hypothetical protein